MNNLMILFKNLFRKYSDDNMLQEYLWTEICDNYSTKDRYYHNLYHLQFMMDELAVVQNEIIDIDSIRFAIFYHDIVYRSSAKDNEEKSAQIAINRLSNLNLSKEKIAQISTQILATKSHNKSINADTNYLLDTDLCILGKCWEEYEEYSLRIRKEYSIYPDFLYKPGRKKLLKNFLSFDKIYKTEAFQEKYESQARYNLQQEIDTYL